MAKKQISMQRMTKNSISVSCNHLQFRPLESFQAIKLNSILSLKIFRGFQKPKLSHLENKRKLRKIKIGWSLVARRANFGWKASTIIRINAKCILESR